MSKPKKKVGPHGVAHIYASLNNTIISITDTQGNSISWSSSGRRGFRGSKKRTPFAAQVAAEQAAREARDYGVVSVNVSVKGPGPGRESSIRGISNAGLRLHEINEGTLVAHNGCRPSKRRRV